MDADDQSGSEAPVDSAQAGTPEGTRAGGEPAPVDEPTQSFPVGEPPMPERAARPQPEPVPIALDQIDEDTTFLVRELGELSHLATDLARLGQLYAVDLRPKGPDRYQVVTGFRRIAALRFLQRDKVLARVHAELPDEDALLMALASAIHTEPVSPEELSAAQQRLEQEGRLSSVAKDMLEKALAVEDEEGEGEEEQEVDADELADDVTERLGDINQDLALLADVFKDLDQERKEELIKQLRYAADLVAFLEGQ